MKAAVLLLVSGLLTAGVFITGKQAGSEQLSPLLILFWQMNGGALVVWLVSWPSRQFPVWNAEHVRYYLVGGLLGISLPYVIAFVVMQQLQVGIVGLLTALSPVVTYAMARSMGIEQGHPVRLAGLVIGLSGVGLMLLPQSDVELSGAWYYMVIALGIPVLLAASNIYRSKFWPAGSQARPLVAGMLTVQGVCLLFINMVLGNFQLNMPGMVNSLPLLVLLGMLAGTSYLSSFNLLRIGGPVYLSQMGYIITAVTLLAGVVLWDEYYGIHDLLSMGLILVGVLLTTITQSGRTKPKKIPVTVSGS